MEIKHEICGYETMEVKDLVVKLQKILDDHEDYEEEPYIKFNAGYNNVMVEVFI